MQRKKAVIAGRFLSKQLGNLGMLYYNTRERNTVSSQMSDLTLNNALTMERQPLHRLIGVMLLHR
jgi:hypothetical protein